MLRKIERKDRKKYLELARAFYHSEAVLHTVPESYFENTFDEMMRSSVYAEGYILSDGQDCGYALLAKSFSQEAGGLVVWLDEFFVEEAHRGKGLGKEFMEFLFANYGGKARIRLEVEPTNVKAEKLYKKVGFTDLLYKQMVLERKD